MDTPEATGLSGAQYVIAGHGYRAVIASVGASLRVLQHHDRDLVVPFDVDEVRPKYRGAVLAPWPNRVVDGRYSFAGQNHQLALTEPDRGHALHGLVGWADFACRAAGDDSVTLTTQVPAQIGYPYPVRVDVTYAISANGLTTIVTGTNLGSVDAPWGTGPHPYLVAGPGVVDDWTLSLPARQVLTVTEDRLTPRELERVDGSDFDFTSPRLIGPAEIDHAFTDLQFVDDLTAVQLDSGDHGVRFTWGRSCPWVQIHTADLPGDAAAHRIGLAVEPMTCAPDAFNSPDRGLIRLPPGSSHSSWWRLGAT